MVQDVGHVDGCCTAIGRQVGRGRAPSGRDQFHVGLLVLDDLGRKDEQIRSKRAYKDCGKRNEPRTCCRSSCWSASATCSRVGDRGLLCPREGGATPTQKPSRSVLQPPPSTPHLAGRTCGSADVRGMSQQLTSSLWFLFGRFFFFFDAPCLIWKYTFRITPRWWWWVVAMVVGLRLIEPWFVNPCFAGATEMAKGAAPLR